MQTVSVYEQLVPEFGIETLNVKKIDYETVTEKYQVKSHICLYCVYSLLECWRV